MMTGLEDRGTIEVNGLTFDVIVVSRRKRYGHTDLLVTPVSGVGKRWMEKSKVAMFGEQLPTPPPYISTPLT